MPSRGQLDPGHPTVPNRVAWSTPPKTLSAVENEIHVWRTSLELAPDLIRRFKLTLSDDEKSRAVRFRFSRDRESFVATRGVLRELIGVYLKRPPSEVRFCYGPHGKLFIPSENLDCPIRFNLSHTWRSSLYAFAHGREVGIDLESIRLDFPWETVAERFFSTAEVAELGGLPADLRAEGFFNCWTRKEAYVKARGEGLETALDSFEVTLTPGVPARFVQGVDSCWNLVTFTPEVNHVSALVYKGSPCKVRFFSFELPIKS